MRKFNFLNIILLFFNAPFSAPLFAAERIELYNGVRQMGMGGAYVTTVNDETALILNPAGLGKLRDKFITVLDPQVGLGADTQALLGTDASVGLSPQRVLDTIEAKGSGSRFHEDLMLFPSMVFPNFGIGVLYRVQSSGTMTDATNARIDYQEDAALVVGYNFRIWNGIIKLGFNAKIDNHTVINSDLLANTANLTVDNNGQEGVGVSSDVGLLVQVPWVWLPSIGAVARNAGGTSYNIQDGILHNTATRPSTDKQTIDAGFSVSPILGKKNRMTITGELHDVMDIDDENDAVKRTHYGLEFNFGDVFFLRAGMNQNYYTAGVELAILNYQIQAATYGEEIGTLDDRQEDRRYMFKFAWRY